LFITDILNSFCKLLDTKAISIFEKLMN